jgi:hypothetical protein
VLEEQWDLIQEESFRRVYNKSYILFRSAGTVVAKNTMGQTRFW